MKTLPVHGPAQWYLAAVNAARATPTSEAFMEHRWGHRRPCQARVHVSAGGGIVGAARIRDISISGAFLETSLRLPIHGQILVSVLRGDGTQHSVEFSATVVRHASDGVGVEWCEPVSGPICDALECALACDRHS
jgi:PilZ domain-containing protein